jgi:hypothetical protein
LADWIKKLQSERFEIRINLSPIREVTNRIPIIIGTKIMKSIKLFLLLTFGFSLSLSAQELKVSQNQRFLETANGDPFFWLGDTAWELFHKLDREEASYYLETRAAQGFSVIQAVILAERDGIRVPNAYGELPFKNLDPTQPNEAYFEHVDFIISKANELGLVVGVLPTWGDKVYSINPGSGPEIFNASNAFAYGKFLGKRYRKADLVWILGGDRKVANEEVAEIWNQMAAGLAKGDKGKNLMTYHPRGGTSSSQFFHNADWLDFNLYQSGHNQKYHNVYDWAEKDLGLSPLKPTIDGEPPYEDIPVAFWNYMKFQLGEFADKVDSVGNIVDITDFERGFFNGYDVRVHAYWDLLAGSAGYTYGNNAVWQMHKKGEVFVIPTLTDWKDALHRPGAESMKYVRAFFEKIGFGNFIPDQTLIVSANPEGELHLRAALDKESSLAVIYFAKGQTAQLGLSKLSAGELTQQWFNPRTGAYSEIELIQKSPSTTITTPTDGPEEDWVLVIRAVLSRQSSVFSCQ